MNNCKDCKHWVEGEDYYHAGAGICGKIQDYDSFTKENDKAFTVNYEGYY